MVWKVAADKGGKRPGSCMQRMGSWRPEVGKNRLLQQDEVLWDRIPSAREP